jgi:hypothetical protein
VNVAALPQVVAIAAGHVTFEAASFETSATLDQRHIDALQQSSDQYVPVAVISKLICVAASVA